MVTHSVCTVHCYGMTSSLLVDRNAVSAQQSEKSQQKAFGLDSYHLLLSDDPEKPVRN